MRAFDDEAPFAHVEWVIPGDTTVLTATPGDGTGLCTAASHVIGLGCLVGGQLSWNWPSGGGSCTLGSCGDPNAIGCPNIGGPIGMGLLSAEAIATAAGCDAAAILSACVAVGDYEITNIYTNGEYRFASFDPAFLRRLTARTGDTTYSDHAATEYFDELTAATYGPSDWDTAGYIAAVQAARSGSLINLRPWDFHQLPWVAGEIGNGGQQAAFEGAVLDGLNTLDQDINIATDFGDVIGLAGAVRGLALNGTTSFPAIVSPNHPDINGLTTLCDLADVLAGYQNSDGSWYYYSDPAETPAASDKDTQTTAYAVLALLAAQDEGCAGYADNIAKGRNWLYSMQMASGGFESYPGAGTFNIEGDGEAINAVLQAPIMTLDNTGTRSVFRSTEPAVDRRVDVAIGLRNLAATQSDGLTLFVTDMEMSEVGGGDYNQAATGHSLAFHGDVAALTDFQSTGTPDLATGEDLLDIGATQPPGVGTANVGIPGPITLLTGYLQVSNTVGVYKAALNNADILVYKEGSGAGLPLPNTELSPLVLKGFVDPYASEVQFKIVTPGDCDASGCVDGVDFIAFTDAFTGPQEAVGFVAPSEDEATCFDFDDDGDIDYDDLIQFMLIFGTGC